LGVGSWEIGDKSWGWSFFPIFHLRSAISFADCVGEFHHVIKPAAGFIAADLQDVHKAFVAAGERLKAADAGELAFVGARVFEVVAIDDLDGSPRAEGVARQPDLLIS
jgi:hypothetical protein